MKAYRSMLNIENIKYYATDYPESWTFLGAAEEAHKLPEEHKDQIHFLNEEASTFLRNYIKSSKMCNGPLWEPFNAQYFKTVEEFQLNEDNDKDLKKWLYHKGIPFDKFVFVDSDRSGQALALTWKMLIKYWEGLFFADDLIVFDESLNWGLFYFHEDRIYFGHDKIYDQNLEYEKTIALEKLKQKFFQSDPKAEPEKQAAIKVFKTKFKEGKIPKT